MDPDPTDSGPKLVVVVAPQIPPMHGQAFVSKAVAERLEAEGCRVAWVSRNPPQLGRGVRYRLDVLRRLLGAATASMGHRRTPKSIYVGSSGGLGVLAEGLCVFLMRRRTDRLVVHHHSFAYLNTPSRTWRLLLRTVYRNANHVTLCECMAERFSAVYRVKRSGVVVVSNSIFVDVPSPLPKRPGTLGLRVGHVSNLSLEKGLAEVLEAADHLPDGATLAIYGRPVDQASERLLKGAIARHATRIEWVQPGGRDDLWSFLVSLDLFLFPSKYKNEAAPMVVYEAMAAGVPVLTSDVGCLPEMANENGGCVAVGLSHWTRVLGRQLKELRKVDPSPGEIERRLSRATQVAQEWSRLQQLFVFAAPLERQAESASGA